MKKKRRQNQNRAVDSDLSACQDKLSFDTQKQANAAKIVADVQHGASLKAYQCQNCGLWHLTSNYWSALK